MSESHLGKYLVIEGSDGVGKTTQKSLLLDRLSTHRDDVIGVIDTGSTDIGTAIRGLIIDPSISKTPETEFDLFTVVRRELAAQVIQPNVKKGSVILSDRNWFSAVAYQGFGRGLDIDMIIERSKRAMGDFFMPDGVVILDAPIEVKEERLRLARPESDWFEKEGRSFFERVARGYHWLAEKFDVEVIDCTPSVNAVHELVFSQLGKIALEQNE
ncbi:MAG TPA: dTMP kinase [Candidatus Sulfotelmatobacter sp.]|nr:dTMP kinase [Candidatus Sulfotelmatobacter sp.]